MKIILNNTPETLADIEKLTVAELLKVKNFSFKMLVIKINEHLVKKEDYATTTVKDGDNVAIIHLISGG